MNWYQVIWFALDIGMWILVLHELRKLKMVPFAARCDIRPRDLRWAPPCEYVPPEGFAFLKEDAP